MIFHHKIILCIAWLLVGCLGHSLAFVPIQGNKMALQHRPARDFCKQCQSPCFPRMPKYGKTLFYHKQTSQSATATPTTCLYADAVDSDCLTTNDPDDDDSYQVALRNTFWSIAVALLFGAGLWVTVGPTVSQEYFAGYIVEKSLSVDNLFVFLLLFDYFQVPTAYQNRVLTWGIYGSIIMRAIMIAMGAAALEHFRAVLLVFAAILIYSALQVLFEVEEEQAILLEAKGGEESLDLHNNPVVWLSQHLCENSDSCDVDAIDFNDANAANPVVLLSRSLFPSTHEYDGDRFFTIDPVDGMKKATPLFVCMVAVELSDVVFAVDSIPAVFGVTNNPLVVFSSNMFAILGLRSLFPVLSKAATEMKYLEPAVAVILAFIGGKMIAEYFGYAIATEKALVVILSLLGLGIGASLLDREQAKTVDVD